MCNSDEVNVEEERNESPRQCQNCNQKMVFQWPQRVEDFCSTRVSCRFNSIQLGSEICHITNWILIHVFAKPWLVQSCKWHHLRPFELIYFKPARRVKRIKKKTIIVGKSVFHVFTQTCVNCVILWTKYQKHLSAWHRTLKVTSALIHPDGCQQRTKHFQDVAPVPAIQYVRLINWQQESIFCHLV